MSSECKPLYANPSSSLTPARMSSERNLPFFSFLQGNTSIGHSWGSANESISKANEISRAWLSINFM
eukprot:1809672-Amphidinium_carterae.1